MLPVSIDPTLDKEHRKIGFEVTSALEHGEP